MKTSLWWRARGLQQPVALSALPHAHRESRVLMDGESPRTTVRPAVSRHSGSTKQRLYTMGVTTAQDVHDCFWSRSSSRHPRDLENSC